MLAHAARCAEQLVQLRAFRPLLSAWGACRLHSASDSDSDGELDPAAAAFFADLRRDSALLASAGGGAELHRHEQLLEAAEGTDEGVPVGQQRLLQVGVMGVPNAGKSTLVNVLAGFKVSAVSPKTNTTERPRLGAFTEGPSQVVLYDTPGVVDKLHYKNAAHRQRVRGTWAVAADCDLLLLLVDAARELQRADPRVHRLVEESASGARLGMPPGWRPPPGVLVLNKCDAIARPQRAGLLPLADKLRALRPFEDVFFVSAKDGRGLPELRQFLLDRATPGEWALGAGMATDRGEEEQALEVVREQLFLRLYKEVPYETSLRVTSCLPQPDGSVHIEMDVVVRKDSQKVIVVGRSGEAIGGVMLAAEKELRRMWGTGVRLVLTVKVHKPG